MKWLNKLRSRSRDYKVSEGQDSPKEDDAKSLAGSPRSAPRTPRERKYLQRRARTNSMSALSVMDQSDASFVVVDPDDVQELRPTFGSIEDKRLPEPSDMDHHHADDVLEKSYGDITGKSVDDLIGQLAETESGAAVAKAVEEAPKHVDDFLTHGQEQIRESAVDVGDLLGGSAYDKPHDLPVHPQYNDDLDDFLAVAPPAHPVESPVSPGGDTVGKLVGDASDEDEAPEFGVQTPEETTFERSGPLTIPADLIEQPEPEEEDEPLPVHTSPHHGFETVARPPTPPKDISDEDVKPSTVHLGHHEHHTTDPHRSILKHGSSVHGSHPSGRGPWIDFKTVDPCVLDLIYWRDPKKSGIALGALLAALFVLTRFPLITIVSYAGLAALAATLGYRVFRAAQAQINKTPSANPFQPYLDQDLSLPQDRVHEQVDVLVEHGQCLAKKLRSIFLVENIVESAKFGLLLWSLTYIGAWFSGCTLAFLAVIGLFSIPKIYETYQEPIDAQLGMIKGHIDNVTAIVEEKVPFLKRAAVAEEKKEQ